MTFRDEFSVAYACELFNTLRLFKKPIYCKPSKDGKKSSQSPASSPSTTPQLITPDRPIVNNSFGRQVSSSPTRSFTPQEGNSQDRRGYFSGDDRWSYNGQHESREFNNRPNYDARQHGNVYNSRGRYNNATPGVNREDELLRYDPREDDRSRGASSNDRFDNRRNSGSSSPLTNIPNLSPLFVQAVNQSISHIRRQSDSTERRHSSNYGPTRHEQIPRHRQARRQYSQPY